jgi:hypothetical protein
MSNLQWKAGGAVVEALIELDKSAEAKGATGGET